MPSIVLFTDGSCNPKTRVGVGACLFVSPNLLQRKLDQTQRLILTQSVQTRSFPNTSSTKLELQTAVWGLELALEQSVTNIKLFTDSQALAGLNGRRLKLENRHFLSLKNNKPLANAELYKRYFALTDALNLEVVCVRGHMPTKQQNSIQSLFSIVDKQSRKKLREINSDTAQAQTTIKIE